MGEAVEKVAVNYLGVDLEGEIISRDGASLCVEITKPYKKLKTCRYITTFSRKSRDFTTIYGDERSVDLLKSLYDLGSYLEKNRDRLANELAKSRIELDQVLKPGLLTKEEYQEKRRQLRRRLRHEALDQKVYDKLLRFYKAEFDAYEWKVIAIKDKFFSQMPELHLNSFSSGADQVVEFIDGQPFSQQAS